MASPDFSRWRASVLAMTAILAVLVITTHKGVHPWLRASDPHNFLTPEAQAATQELRAFQERETQQLSALKLALTPGNIALSMDPKQQQQQQQQQQQEKKIISFGLHGAHEKYVQGALKNAALARLYYPGWTCRFYVGSASGAVPEPAIAELRRAGAEIVYDDSDSDTNGSSGSSSGSGNAAMFSRFRVALDPSVSRFIVRDVDSRLNARESAAVDAWVSSGLPVHIMRDHPTHCKYSILGGMWGATNASLPALGQALRQWRDKSAWGDDMDFLTKHVWSEIQAATKHLAHDSHCCQKFPSAHPFPTARQRAFFVGQAFNSRHRSRYDEHALQPAPRQCRRRPEDTYG